MRIRLTILATGLLVLGSLTAAPALATDSREAIRLCDKRPGCEAKVRGNWVDIFTPEGDIIMCPIPNGECICATCPVRTDPGAGKRRQQVAPQADQLLSE